VTRVLSVASEIYPLVKTGGLADVVGALPAALAAENVEVCTLVPGYPAVTAAFEWAEAVHHFPDLFGGPARLLSGRAAGLELFVIEAPHLFTRPGGPYAGPDGLDWPDNAFRFAALSRVAADIGRGLIPAFLPDVIQGHDWQAGLAPAYLHYSGGPRPGTVMTVHNLAYQGQFPAELLSRLELPPHAYHVNGVEYYGAIGYLKAGLLFADRITTVSPTYAAEIVTNENGMGLGALLRTRAAVLTGILNGIDAAVWNPATDSLLPTQFDAASLERRAINKAVLQARLALAADPATLLLGVITRLTWQKGMDLLLAAVPALIAAGAQLAVLGSGDGALEQGFAQAAATHPGRIGIVLGQDEPLAHLIQGGSDALIVPSRYEPCGLAQLCALRYGALPVVARVGGLSDTVIDANEMALAAGVATGFQFAPVTSALLKGAIRRAASVWKNRSVWRRLQNNAMVSDVGWTRPARQYAALYRGIDPAA
jgi:starch synthase